MPEIPSGTLTLLFSDLEGSTDLLRRLGPVRYAELLCAHRDLMGAAIDANAGLHVDTQGDSFFCVFTTARDAIAAAVAIQRAHRAHAFPEHATVRVRIGLHTGEPVASGDRYVGLAVHRAARIMSAAHGGQILVSGPTADLLADETPADVAIADLGEYRLKGLERAERLFELRIGGAEGDFAPPRGAEPVSDSAPEGAEGSDFRLLGPLEVQRGQRRLTFGGERRGALLALLLLNANHVVSIDQLIDELWEEPPRSGAKAVQVRISQLRKILADVGLGELIATRPPGYVIELSPDQVDLHRFERLVSESDAVLSADPARAAELLRAALGLWRGTPLAEFKSASFARAASARLEEVRQAAVERRIEADLGLGRHADLIGELESLISQHPFRERLRAQLMLALYRSGRQAEALDAARAARRELVEKLGIEPSKSLQELERAILRHDPGLALDRDPSFQEERSVVWETHAPVRSILVAPSELSQLESLVAVAEPLSERPRRELILSLLVEGSSDLAATSAELDSVRSVLATRGIPSRVAAFTSADRGRDLVRLASEQDVDLLLMDAPEALFSTGVPPDDLADVWREAPCDVVVAVGSGRSPALRDGPILIPFGGGEHDWAAVEIGAWLAAAQGARLQLLGSAAGHEGGKRDASRSLAVVSLVVQRAAGISATPLLMTSARELLQTARSAGLLLVGLSDRWSQEGLGAVRLGLARDAGVPTLLVRRGLRPGGLTPPERMTRYTWSFAHQGEGDARQADGRESGTPPT